MTDRIPDRIARATVELFGAEGTEWLQRLPSILAECERRWSLRVSPPFPDLSYNYVAPALRADGREVVLKVGFPSRELMTEMEALRLYDGQGIVQLLGADPGLGAMVLERLRPGTPLSRLDDDERATSIAAGVMQQLWRPVPPGHGFPSVAQWAAGLGRLREQFDGGTGPLPARLVEEAEALFADLLETMAEPVLLHGDLHHDNISAAERQPWLALDPKGVVGEPAYEVGALLRNPIPRVAAMPHLDRVMARRVDQLSEALGFDRARIRGWGVAQAVLSAWWSLEDHGHGWDIAITCAEAIARVKA